MPATSAPPAAPADISARQLVELTGQERDWFYQLVGQNQMAEANHQMSRVFSLQKLAEIKAHKLYRHLKGRPVRPDSEQIMTGTWADFCVHGLGRSVDAVDLDLANLATFGEGALEAMQRAGIGYRQLRDLRRLPEDARAALVEAAAGEDKEALLETAEALLARKEAEQAALKAKIAEAQQNLEVKDRLLKDRGDELTQAKERLAFVQTSQADREAAIRAEVAGLATEALSVLKVKLAEGFKVLTEAATGGDASDRKRFMAAQIRDLRAAIAQIQDQYGLPDDPAEVGGPPVWLTAGQDGPAA